MKALRKTVDIEKAIGWELYKTNLEKGYPPDEAAQILLQAQRMCVDACRRLLEEIRNREATDGKPSGGIFQSGTTQA